MSKDKITESQFMQNLYDAIKSVDNERGHLELLKIYNVATGDNLAVDDVDWGE